MTLIAGQDENGMGPLAGPCFVTVVVIEDGIIPGVKDSKKLTDGSRRMIADMLKQKAKFLHIASRTNVEIDARGLEICWAECQKECADKVRAVYPDIKIYADNHPWKDSERLRTYLQGIEFVENGDDNVYAIGAASIIGKVAQCEFMDAAHAQYGQYGFIRHRGYPTPEHITAIHKHGLSPIHRASVEIPQTVPVQKATYDPSRARDLLESVRQYLSESWIGDWEKSFLTSILRRVDAGGRLTERQMYFLVGTVGKVKRQAKKHKSKL